MRTWISIVLALLAAAAPIVAPAVAQEQEQGQEQGQEEPTPRGDWWDEARALYEKAKAAGETGAEDAAEWLAEDFRRMAAWEYKVVRLTATSDDSLEAELNRLGEERWECFHVEVEKRDTVLFLKRPSRSYLRAAPISELLKLLPRGEREE